MELVRQASTTQLLFPVAAVAVVLLCAALVFIFGFHSAEQPQFDKLPLVLDDRKSKEKKRKPKEKKSSPNRSANEESKTKSEKKSPSKEKKEVKEPEKPKSKEKTVEPKLAKKEELKKGKKKNANTSEKPSDFDEGLWEEVPKKTFIKKVKTPEEKKEEKKMTAVERKESPKKEKREPKVSSAVKGAGDAAPVQEEIQLAQPSEDTGDEKTVLISASSNMDEAVVLALQAQVEEVQRKLKEAERRQQAALGISDEAEADAEEKDLTDVKDLRSNKKQENKEKQKKKAIEAVASRKSESIDEPEPVEKTEEAPAAVFDELGDTWTDAKAPKKGKKKARKDQ